MLTDWLTDWLSTNDVICIGDDIKVMIVACPKTHDGITFANTVALGVDAPRSVPIWRAEVVERTQSKGM